MQLVKRIKTLLTALAITLIFTSPIHAKRLALVIGNNDYEHVEKLKKAVNDSIAIGDTLKTLGFEVMQAHNLDRRAMNLKLAQFIEKLENGDEALFFYAGHGVELEGSNYLLPTDIPGGTAGGVFVRSEAIGVNRILDLIRTRGVRVSILVLDACRNNPFQQVAGRSIGAVRGLARIAAPEGTFIMYSAGVGQMALDGLTKSDPDPNSIFTRTLVPLLKQPGLKLTDMARAVRQKVKKLAKSVNHTQRPAYYDEVTGNFLFLPGNAEDTRDKTTVTNSKVELTYWNSIKDSTQSKEFNSYIDKYPNGAFVSLAKLRISALSQKNDDKLNLTEEVQKALKVAKCYDGKIDGVWGRKSQIGLEKFSKAAHFKKRFFTATQEALELVRENSGVTCVTIQKETIVDGTSKKVSRCIRYHKKLCRTARWEDGKPMPPGFAADYCAAANWKRCSELVASGGRY